MTDVTPEGNLCSETACAKYRLELEDRIHELQERSQRQVRLRYLFMSSSGIVFPCHARELKLHFDVQGPFKVLEAWPGNSHGPAFPFGRYTGVIVLDLLAEDPIKPLTVLELAMLCG